MRRVIESHGAEGAEPETATEAGLVSDTQSTLTNLPPNQTLIIAISARNSSGETTPTEVVRGLRQT